MQRFKLIAALVLLVLVVVVVLQNTAPVETRILFITLVMPRAALLGLTLLVGVAAGILIAMSLSHTRKKKPE